MEETIMNALKAKCHVVSIKCRLMANFNDASGNSEVKCHLFIYLFIFNATMLNVNFNHASGTF